LSSVAHLTIALLPYKKSSSPPEMKIILIIIIIIIIDLSTFDGVSMA